MRHIACPGARRGMGPRVRGFSLIEVLVTIVVLTFGLLGLSALQGRALIGENEAYQRAQAGIFLSDMVDRLSANRLAAPCFANGQNMVNIQSYGTGVTALPACTGQTVGAAAMSSADLVMQGWHNQLLGTMVTKGTGNNVGGIMSARGCVSAHPTDPNLYYIAVAWQGFSDTIVPAVPAGADAGLTAAIACGVGSYGTSDASRRLVWTSVRIAILN